MKKALCLFNAYVQQEGPKYTYERMKEEFAKLGVVLEWKTNSEILSYLDQNGSFCGLDLSAYAFCLYLDKDKYISYLLEKRGLRLFNSAESIRLCDDKMLTYLFLANHGIRMPKSVTAPLNYSHQFDPTFLKNVEKELSFPFVAKENYGSLGNGVYLIQNESELISFEKKFQNEAHLYQEFIESSYGFDYRLILIGGKFVTGYRRHNLNGDFRSNIAQGGIGEKAEIPESYQKFAEKIALLLHLDYCGVDLLTGKDGEPVLCEVNSNAFMAGSEKTTGVNVAKAYAEHILQSL